jgi:hypothetical protein
MRPLTSAVFPRQVLPLLASESQVLRWNERGLSVQLRTNDAIVASGLQFPILVDPHGVGVRAIAELEKGRDMVVIDLHGGTTSATNYMAHITEAVRTNTPVLVLNVGQKIPAELKDFAVAALSAGDRKIEFDNL